MIIYENGEVLEVETVTPYDHGDVITIALDSTNERD